ncbi:MAG: hypothetical protein NTV70_10590 [Acidobacteria bacterium]|nr:hypothetical protein [Acidobacteriota bacterium]
MIKGNLLQDFIRMALTALWIAGVSLTFKHLVTDRPAHAPVPATYVSGVAR